MIVETSGWRHLKEKNKLFLSCEYQKTYTPSPKTAQLPKIATNRKWKTFFFPTFQKVELRNLTFFQLYVESWIRVLKGAATTKMLMTHATL